MLEYKKEGSYHRNHLQAKATASKEQERFLKECFCGPSHTQLSFVQLSGNRVHICRPATVRSPGEGRGEGDGSGDPKLSSDLRHLCVIGCVENEKHLEAKLL